MIPYEDATTLSLLYHLNSEPWQNVEAYQGGAYEVDYREFPRAAAVTLSAPVDSPLRRLLVGRESCRRYDLRRLELAVLSNLLANACGISRREEVVGGSLCLLRTAPSAGGLYPVELYVVTRKVEGLADGLHHYNVRSHALEPLRLDISLATLAPVMLTYPEEVNAIFFLSAVFARAQKKYGPRGYRYILLEAGHVAQSLCLSAVEQGLGSLCMGGFQDAALNRWLGLNGISEAIVYSVAVGHAARGERDRDGA
jgi:SagB-type dehydrogenase family enzyme